MIVVCRQIGEQLNAEGTWKGIMPFSELSNDFKVHFWSSVLDLVKYSLSSKVGICHLKCSVSDFMGTYNVLGLQICIIRKSSG
jgi:hypothetical protein